MNYQKIYDNLIKRGVNREIPKEYTEKHHIIPKCLGGSNDPSNIVVLTAREHFVAHQLLFKIHRTNKLAFAVIAFKASTKHQIRNSRMYSWIRQLKIKTMKDETHFKDSEFQSKYGFIKWENVYNELCEKHGFENIQDFADELSHTVFNERHYLRILEEKYNFSGNYIRAILRKGGYPNHKGEFKLYYISKKYGMSVDEFSIHLKTFQKNKRIPTSEIISCYPELTHHLVRILWRA